MNICLINDSFPPVIDGVANVVMNYAKILNEMDGAKAIVATPKFPDMDYSTFPYEVIPFESIDTTKASGGYRAGNPFDARALRKMEAFEPDIIHAHSPAAASFMARVLRSGCGAPIVYTYHTKYDIDIARAIKGELLQKEAIHAIVENISACDEVWAVSRGAGENLKSLGYEGTYRVVSNGVDFPKGRVSETQVAEVTKGFDLPENVPVFLFVGRLMNYKGLPLILDAMRLLAEEGNNFRMVFVGGGGDAEELQEKAVSYGFSVDVRGEDHAIVGKAKGSLPGKIIFTGPEKDRSKLRAWNTRADLFLFPSTFDTNGLVVREAAACGLASVLIEGSCAAEDITDGRNGFLIEEDAESLAAALRPVLKDRTVAKAAGQHAMDEIYLSWDSCVKSAYDLYGELLEKQVEGALKKKRSPMNTFLSFMNEYTEATADLFEVRDEVRDGMLENAAELRKVYEAAAGELHESAKEAQEVVEEGIERVEARVKAFERSVRMIPENFMEEAAGLREKTKTFFRGIEDGREETDK